MSVFGLDLSQIVINLADNDPRTNAGQPGYKAALEAAKADFEMHIYPGTRHGFHNNSTPRFNNTRIWPVVLRPVTTSMTWKACIRK